MPWLMVNGEREKNFNFACDAVAKRFPDLVEVFLGKMPGK